jgi:hypothetical protein
MVLDQKWCAVNAEDMHTGNILIHRGNSMLIKWRTRISDVAGCMVREGELMHGTDEQEKTLENIKS